MEILEREEPDISEIVPKVKKKGGWFEAVKLMPTWGQVVEKINARPDLSSDSPESEKKQKVPPLFPKTDSKISLSLKNLKTQRSQQSRSSLGVVNTQPELNSSEMKDTVKALSVNCDFPQKVDTEQSY